MHGACYNFKVRSAWTVRGGSVPKIRGSFDYQGQFLRFLWLHARLINRKKFFLYLIEFRLLEVLTTFVLVTRISAARTRSGYNFTYDSESKRGSLGAT